MGRYHINAAVLELSVLVRSAASAARALPQPPKRLCADDWLGCRVYTIAGVGMYTATQTMPARVILCRGSVRWGDWTGKSYEWPIEIEFLWTKRWIVAIVGRKLQKN